MLTTIGLRLLKMPAKRPCRRGLGGGPAGAGAGCATLRCGTGMGGGGTVRAAICGVDRPSCARMGLAAHLEGVLNGLFLAVLGLIWPNVRLSPAVKVVTRWLAVGGAYLNWFAAFWAAVMGRGRTSPIHPADRPNYFGEHLIVETALALLALAFITTCLLVLFGLRRQQVAPAEGV